jgi:hypothetical protein
MAGRQQQGQEREGGAYLRQRQRVHVPREQQFGQRGAEGPADRRPGHQQVAGKVEALGGH